jgi:hypothetical protein
MRYINQKQYPHWLYVTRFEMEEEEEREKGKTTTVASSACGLCAAIMVADRLLPNCDFDLKQALDLSYAVKANYRKGTSYKRFAPAFAEKLGLAWESTDDPQAVRECLQTGGAVVALTRGDRDGHAGLFTHSAHYITLLNEERDGRFAILDPAFYPGKFNEPDRSGKVELKNEVLILCDEKTLMEQASQTESPFYLFWRK